MKLEIDIPSIIYNDAKENRNYISAYRMEIVWKAIADGKPLEQEPKTGHPQKSCDTCEYSDEIDGTNCYECVKDMRNNYSPKKMELKYCDRNICVSNEYNGIGCNECEVTKSQKPKTGQWITKQNEVFKYYCDKCGTGDNLRTNYCPNCGARMVEPQEREV